MKDKKLLFHSAKLLLNNEFKKDIKEFRENYFNLRNYDEDFFDEKSNQKKSFLEVLDNDDIENSNFLRFYDIEKKLGFGDIETVRDRKDREIFHSKEVEILKDLERKIEDKDKKVIIKDLNQIVSEITGNNFFKSQNNINVSYLFRHILESKKVEGFEEYYELLDSEKEPKLFDKICNIVNFLDGNHEYIKFGNPIVGYITVKDKKPDIFVRFQTLFPSDPEKELCEQYYNILNKWRLKKYKQPFLPINISYRPLRAFFDCCFIFGVDVISDYYEEVYISNEIFTNEIYDNFFFQEEALILDRGEGTDDFFQNIIELIDYNPEKAKKEIQVLLDAIKSEPSFIYPGKLPSTKKDWNKIYDNLKVWGYPVKSNKEIERFMRGFVVYKRIKNSKGANEKSKKTYDDVAKDLLKEKQINFGESQLRDDVLNFKKLAGI